MLNHTSNLSYNIKHYDATLLPNGSYINKYNTINWYNDKGDSHRENGPAILYTSGNMVWILHDNYYTFKEYLKATPISDEQKLLLRLQYD